MYVSGVTVRGRVRRGLLALAGLSNVLPHERTVPENLLAVIRSLRATGEYTGPPILVERRHMVILDGHHRAEALRMLGARAVPALLVDYSDPGIILGSWRGARVSRREVLARALRGELFPPKTTRHIILFGLPSVRAPLELLRSARPRVLVVGEEHALR